MKRRDFSLALGAVAAAGASALPLTAAHAQALQAGKDYKALSKRAPLDAPAGKIEVIEFFSYGCSHCMTFDPIFSKWAKTAAADVAVRLEHVGFNKNFEPLQKIYYTLEAMGLVGTVHPKVYAALQTERKPLNKEDALFAWVAEQGVDSKKFAEIYKSFGVANRVRRAMQLQDAYQVEGTPAIGVAGRYYTDGGLTRGFPRMLQVADALIAQERKRG